MSTDIYKGVWINWSEGRVQGATITLSRQSSGILSTFIALYVAFAGSMFWRLFSYILHQISSSDTERNTVHRQRQVILRNTGNIAATWALFALPFRQQQQNFQRSILVCLPYGALALFCFVGFTLAGLFSSRITTAVGPFVLARGSLCGSWTYERDATNAFAKTLADTVEAAAYVRRCYEGNDTTKDSACETFFRPSLPISINANAACPFDETVCNGSSFSMDTGKLDSHFHFGINAPPKDRIQLRRVATCVRIKGVPYTIVNRTDFGQQLFYNAGPIPGSGFNYTFEYNAQIQSALTAYSLEAKIHIDMPVNKFTAGDPGLQWQPIPAFNRSDGDVTLIMIPSNGVRYEQPVDDPIFSAHREVLIKSPLQGLRTIYFPDKSAPLLGCLDQWQFCNPTTGRCSKLSSDQGVMFELLNTDFWGNNNVQEATFHRFLARAEDRTIYGSVGTRAANALQVKDYAIENVGPPMPPNQWQKEVTAWFQVALAREQMWAVEWATGPRNLRTSLTGVTAPVKPTEYPWDRKTMLCDQQIIHDNGMHQNFSILGLALTLALGGLCVIGGLTADVVFGKLFLSKSKQEQWSADEILSLLKTKTDSSSEVNYGQDGEMGKTANLA